MLFIVCELLWIGDVHPEPQGTPPMKKPRKDDSDAIYCSWVLMVVECMALTLLL